MIWYQWVALLWMASVAVVCGGHILGQAARWPSDEYEPVAPQFLVLAVSVVFTAMAFYGVRW